MILDSVETNRVERPESVDALAEIVGSGVGRIGIFGACTALDFGNPLQPVDWAVDTRSLNRVTEYVPEDLTIHVESGVTIGQIQSVLDEHNQILPLDPWGGPDATIGGIVATNAQGSLRTVGSVRDWIIGMRVVNADGRQSRTGGRVVKNVSGYDLAKLYVGSLGSLAVISEISFKLRPHYEKTVTARLSAEDRDELLSAISVIRYNSFDPISLIWTGPTETVIVRFGDHPEAVDWQLENLPRGSWERIEEEEEQGFWEQVRGTYKQLGDVVLRVAVPPTRISELIDRVRPNSWIAHASVGVVLMGVSGVEDISEIRKHFPAVIEKAPRELREGVATFGLNGRELELMRALKDSFDPNMRLNPGRHVDGEARV